MDQTNQIRIFANEARLNEAKSYEPYELAMVTEQQREIYTILLNGRFINAKVSGKMMYQATSPKAFPSVGDWVMVENVGDIAIIHAILNRTSILERKAAGPSPTICAPDKRGCVRAVHQPRLPPF